MAFLRQAYFKAKYFAQSLLHGAVAAATAAVGGGFSRSTRKPQIVVVSVDGQDYRVPIAKFADFLASIKEEIKQTGTVKTKKKKLTATPPKIAIKSVPVEYQATAEAEVERMNTVIAGLWERILARLIENEDDEITVLLLATY